MTGTGWNLQQQIEDNCPREMEAYERILGDALSGHRTNFAREDYKSSRQIVAPTGGWHNPSAAEKEDFRVAAQIG